MSTFLTFLIIIGAYWLGFATAAMLSAAKKADEQAERQHVKESLTTAPEWNPPFNWCGEQGAPFDEYGMTYRCYICGRVLQEDSHLCELCVRQHGRKVNV